MLRPQSGPCRAAVLGSPISHSLSPVLHRAGFAALGLSRWRYEAIDCDAAALGPLVVAQDPSWVGFSVTMPGKSAAAAVADACSSRVAVLGAANTLVRTAGGWFAENTDVDGVLGALRAAGVAAPRSALILGGGGTALAVIAALAEQSGGQPIAARLAGRRPPSTARAAELADGLGLRVTTLGFTVGEITRAAGEVDLVVSTVPASAADRLAGPLAGVPALLDVIYHPWPTALAATARPGRVTVTGLDLLLHQALRQFEMFTGESAPAGQMRDALRAAVGTAMPLPL